MGGECLCYLVQVLLWGAVGCESSDALTNLELLMVKDSKSDRQNISGEVTSSGSRLHKNKTPPKLPLYSSTIHLNNFTP